MMVATFIRTPNATSKEWLPKWAQKKKLNFKLSFIIEKKRSNILKTSLNIARPK